MFTTAGLISAAHLRLAFAISLGRGSSLLRWKQRPAGVVKKNAEHSSAVKSAMARECGMNDGHLFSPGKLKNTNAGPRQEIKA
jgi:hypothetical protein